MSELDNLSDTMLSMFCAVCQEVTMHCLVENSTEVDKTNGGLTIYARYYCPKCGNEQDYKEVYSLDPDYYEE